MFLSSMPYELILRRTQWEITMATPKWQASFFQEKEWLPLPIKDLTKIVLDPYQTPRHMQLEGHLKVNWFDFPLGASVGGVPRECINTLRTTRCCLLGHLWSFPSSFSYLPQLTCFLYPSGYTDRAQFSSTPALQKCCPWGFLSASCQSLCTYKSSLTTEALLFLLLSLFF